MVADDFHEAAAVGGIVERTTQKRLGESLNRGQGSAELMRDIGGEILAHALEAAKFRDLVQNENSAGGAVGSHGRRRYRETSGPDDTDSDLASDLLALRKRPFDDREQIGLANHFNDGAAFD